MADDAAGAVRRTPRPAPAVPELWWSPTTGLYRQTRYAGLNRILTTEHRQVLGGIPHAALPDDAVRLALDDPETHRPVVLLRAEDCACRYGEDCPHGPEPVDALDLAVWLHAEAAWRVAGFDVLTVSLARKNQQLRAERDEAVALCANLQPTILDRLAELVEASGKLRSAEWLRTCARLPVEEWPPAPAYKGPMVPAAERDALHARLDAVQRWLPVREFEGIYEVSDSGQVRRCSGLNAGRVLRPSFDRYGYQKVSLSKGGKTTTRSVHVIVAAAFHGPRPDGMEVRHLDGDRCNNVPGNLRYGTSGQNKTDMVDHGTHTNAAKTVCPQGHLLVEPNLAAAHLARGGRDCLACHRAHCAVRDAWNRHGRTIDFGEAAEVAFRKIMGADAQPTGEADRG